ncbi:hypothetical protein CK203_112969 [Vitis vinifera]|uniref:Uncharacterized protein n=1 Tax=Vitis vinifera TaxID=29760 RepID=A0A438EAN6_VITVI|nr:hypothetical protein CK203_112969 [Vitis vinifera]
MRKASLNAEEHDPLEKIAHTAQGLIHASLNLKPFGCWYLSLKQNTFFNQVPPNEMDEHGKMSLLYASSPFLIALA